MDGSMLHTHFRSVILVLRVLVIPKTIKLLEESLLDEKCSLASKERMGKKVFQSRNTYMKQIKSTLREILDVGVAEYARLTLKKTSAGGRRGL